MAGSQYIIGGENASYGELFETHVLKSKFKAESIQIHYGLLRGLCNCTSIFNVFSKYNSSLCARILDFIFTERAVSSKKAQDELGYKYSSLDAGLENTYEFSKK